MAIEQIKQKILKAKEYLFARQKDYLEIFVNQGKSSEAVLKDLKRFCRVNETTFDPDPRMHALLEGRREVYLRIQHHIELKSDDLWTFYNGNKN